MEVHIGPDTLLPSRNGRVGSDKRGHPISWQDIIKAHQRLRSAVSSGEHVATTWDEFVNAANRCLEHPPYHLKALFAALTKVQGQREPSELRILDHGCGGALTCLVMLANGYTGIHGIDLSGSNCEEFNSFLNELYQIEEQRFYSYDGTRLPFEDDRFDFVFSQQVIEHVRPNVLSEYYLEEARILRAGGGVYHEVPHRLTPYDSHTRTWFLHYLPRPLWLWSLQTLLGRDIETAREAIFLRWPWRHKAMASSIFGNMENLTSARLRSLSDFEYYDGPVRLRKLMAWGFKLPVVGRLLALLLSNLVMLQTLSLNEKQPR